MTVTKSSSTPEGTHPSRASSMSTIQCDQCDRVFTADCCIDGDWQLHGQSVGAADDEGDLCAECVQAVRDA